MQKKTNYVVYGICMLLGCLFSYMVLGALLNRFIPIENLLPEALGKSVALAMGVVFFFPVISFIIYKMRLQRFDRMIALFFFVLWLVEIGFVIYAVTTK